MSKTVSVWVETYADVSLSDFDTDDLQEELARRGGTPDAGDFAEPVRIVAEKTDLLAIRMLLLQNDYKRASEKFGALLRDALGTAI
ncbi:hypothetical protein M8A51_25660 [Schlegelella sp. S2-27]|uniref:Uncharacterized protein n=1 Tax=Caldimonas mangrovi TaxID=2944811 RepID=A0ABT0YX59_9BURK|nr:hypothetical protein [Caldimonas mangrovi]MCM5682924.1 hypothetical protein [Caldimonas mangrovi]